MINVTPVILCGGSGTRLWPLSRAGFPKQFLCLTCEASLFQQAALRLVNLCDADIQIATPNGRITGQGKCQYEKYPQNLRIDLALRIDWSLMAEITLAAKVARGTPFAGAEIYA